MFPQAPLQSFFPSATRLPHFSFLYTHLPHETGGYVRFACKLHELRSLPKQTHVMVFLLAVANLTGNVLLLVLKILQRAQNPNALHTSTVSTDLLHLTLWEWVTGSTLGLPPSLFHHEKKGKGKGKKKKEREKEEKKKERKSLKSITQTLEQFLCPAPSAVAAVARNGCMQATPQSLGTACVRRFLFLLWCTEPLPT